MLSISHKISRINLMLMHLNMLISGYKEPQPPEPWTDIMDCTYEGYQPVQKEHIFGRVVGSEDCLFVNVFTKEVNPNTLRPVIVSIYGGGYVRGSTSKDVYSPDFFMSKDVVLVTIAYRIGLLGFLSLKDSNLNVPGNAGLKDQVLALKWVQQNILRFGGDPDNVTLIGQSAGASSVHYLGLSDKGKGLFHRMVCMSGSAFCAFASAPYKDWPLRVAKELGYRGAGTDDEILSFLREVDCRRIVAVHNKILRRDELIDGYLGYTIPVVEPYITEQCIIPDHPLIMARSAWGNTIPLIAGGTSREGIYFLKTMPTGILDIWAENPGVMLPHDVKQDPLTEKCAKLGEQLKSKLFGDSELDEDSYLDEPQPPEPWTEVLDGTGEGQRAVQLQFGTGRIVGSEDCLFVNVFTKNAKPQTLKPVVFWIHGGGFIGGSTSRDMYSPDYFMSKDVVYVSAAYRLGTLGFLSLKDASLHIPGNAGLKDLVLALKWIKENVSRFGGDPDNVTLLGESAGAAAVHFLGLTDQTRGLFKRMVCMSGSAFCPWALPSPKDWPIRLAKELGYQGENDEEEILNFLRNVDAKKLVAAELKVLSLEEKHAGYLWPASPVIEPYETDQCFLPKDPKILAKTAWSNDIPMITGCTSREGIFFCNLRAAGLFESWEANPTEILPFELKTKENSTQLGKQLSQLSFGDERINEESYIDLISYKYFWHPVHRMIQSRQKYATAPTFLYSFEFDSPDYAFFKILLSSDKKGVSHGDDLGYMFVNMFSPETLAGSPERRIIKLFIGMITKFAKDSDPNCEELLPITWVPVAPGERPHMCLRIDEECKFEKNPFSEILQAWDSLYDLEDFV